MWIIANTILQSALSGAIRVAAVHGAQAAAMNLAGQAMIHGIAVAAGPIGWAMTGASIAYGIHSFTKRVGQQTNSNSTTT